MSLKPWHLTWSNFRGYGNQQALELPAMTLLIGRNNVGKTSLYAPLLLLRQTRLEAKDPKTALLLRGTLADYGSFRDIVKSHDVEAALKFSLDFGRPNITFSEGENRPNPQRLELTFGQDDQYQSRLIRSRVLDRGGRTLIDRKLKEDGRYQVESSILPKAKQVGRPIREVTTLRRAMEDEQPNQFLFSGVEGLRLPLEWREDSDRWEKAQGWFRAASTIYETYFVINNYVGDCLDGLAYLGPLRSLPKRSYPLSPEAPQDVGRDGETAAELLYRASSESDVLEKVNEWLEKLGYGRLIFESVSPDYFAVLIEDQGSGLQVNFADCGIGLSQLLPLLVQGLLMSTGQAFIAQQPEIHLNPAQQVVMTDFLVQLSKNDRRVIVETHSEHVLLRLRRAVAEEALESDDVAIYYCDRSAAGDSSARKVPMGDLGDIASTDWPKGFFAEQLDNAMGLALVQSRRVGADGD